MHFLVSQQDLKQKDASWNCREYCYARISKSQNHFPFTVECILLQGSMDAFLFSHPFACSSNPHHQLTYVCHTPTTIVAERHSHQLLSNKDLLGNEGMQVQVLLRWTTSNNDCTWTAFVSAHDLQILLT